MCGVLSAGVEDEFVLVGRLDNLAMSFCSLQALVDCYSSAEALQEEPNIKAVALFDHEEVGSASAQGAPSLFEYVACKGTASVAKKGSTCQLVLPEL